MWRFEAPVAGGEEIKILYEKYIFQRGKITGRFHASMHVERAVYEGKNTSKPLGTIRMTLTAYVGFWVSFLQSPLAK